jgi:Flp pilus assembly protein TadD
MRSFSNALTVSNFKALTARKEAGAPLVDLSALEPGEAEAVRARLLSAEAERKTLIAAQIALFEGRKDDAVEAFLEARRIHPGSKEMSFHLERFAAEALAAAYGAYQSSQLAYAESAAEMATRLDPGLADAWQVMGLVAAEGRRWPEAEERFRRAVGLAPRSGSARGNLGFVLMMRGDLAGARRELEQGLALEPRNDAVRERLKELEALEKRQ